MSGKLRYIIFHWKKRHPPPPHMNSSLILLIVKQQRLINKLKTDVALGAASEEHWVSERTVYSLYIVWSV